MYAKVNYGMSLREAMVEFNNKYHIPRLARTIKLISEAQEASSQITDVLSTAAQSSENQDDIERERKSRTRMQVAIILMTYLTLLAVMAILKVQFLDTMASMGGSGGGEAAGAGGLSFGASIDTQLLSLLFFHAVTLQAVLSGIISGYIRDAQIISGVKFVVILQTLALAVWVVVV
jgi:flagellar protein FlaJ